MEICCTFLSIAGRVCGADRRARKQEIRVIPLVTCSKDISKHMSMLSFTGPEDEVDLILCRSGIFTRSEKVNAMTICPLHRAKLGLGWTRGASTRCRIPPSLSNHGKKKGKWPKGERGIRKNESKILLRKTGIFLPVGSGICRKCREIIRTRKTDEDVLESGVLQEMFGKMTVDDEEVTMRTPQQEQLTVPKTPFSMLSEYTPSGFSQASDVSLTMRDPAADEQADTTKDKFNSFLASRDISPIRSTMVIPWDTAGDRTKRQYIRKAMQLVFATLEEIAPSSPEMLFKAIEESLKKGEADDMDSALLEALVESYENSNH
ncbi:PREDICTED: uncharacterized protein LOC107333644 [Acropora digitifera]|uniref:uncharacterized protein LOC107333644 n=1 Tax=Acropora digitifera TaxID=70779 RepID=UPI00077A9750|nr:PREDICTED: uncharacterized protein LOC107333644 [Acropora digitifera]